MSPDPIPAVAEAEATGETAVLFADLRATLAVPFVNLIWRHLATIPGGLAWTWSLVRPLYLSPDLLACAHELQAGIDLPCQPILAFVYEFVGLGPVERAGIEGLIAGYNRGNGLNFLALNLACRVLRREVAVPGTPGQTAAAALAVPHDGSEEAATPRLLGLDELAPPLRALVLDFDQFGRTAPSEAVASLYRHLAHWPAFLALAHTALRPLHTDGSLRVQQEQLIVRSASLVSGRLEPLLQGAPAALGQAEHAHVLSSLEQFTQLMIGRMVVVGTALRVLLPAPKA